MCHKCTLEFCSIAALSQIGFDYHWSRSECFDEQYLCNILLRFKFETLLTQIHFNALLVCYELCQNGNVCLCIKTHHQTNGQISTCLCLFITICAAMFPFGDASCTQVRDSMGIAQSETLQIFVRELFHHFVVQQWLELAWITVLQKIVRMQLAVIECFRNRLDQLFIAAECCLK